MFNEGQQEQVEVWEAACARGKAGNPLLYTHVEVRGAHLAQPW